MKKNIYSIFDTITNQVIETVISFQNKKIDESLEKIDIIPKILEPLWFLYN